MRNSKGCKYFKKTAAEFILFENIQTTCPMSGEELKKKKVFSNFEGRRIFFCCEDCQKKFTANPQKVLSSMDKKSDANEKKNIKGHEGHNH